MIVADFRYKQIPTASNTPSPLPKKNQCKRLHPLPHPLTLTQIQPIQQKILKKQSLFKKNITTFEGNLKKHTNHEYNITHQPQRKLGYPIQ